MKYIITLILSFLIIGKSFAETEKNIYEKIDLFSEVLSKIDKEYVEDINQKCFETTGYQLSFVFITVFK